MPGRLLLACLVLALAASPALAANARHPYQNVDPRVDAGSDTGDRHVDALNARQLERTYYGYGRPPVRSYAPRPNYPAPGYYPPAPYPYAAPS